MSSADLTSDDVVAVNGFADRLETALQVARPERYQVPLNREEQKLRSRESCSQGLRYNPVFAYYPSDPSDGERALEDLEPASAPWFDELTAGEIDLMKYEFAAAHLHDADLTTEATVRRFGRPGSALRDAIRILEQPTLEEHITRDRGSELAAKTLSECLGDLGLHHWSVKEVHNMAARMSVSGAERVLRIRQGEYFSDHEIARLMLHEIGTHIFRSENGRMQPLRLFRFGLGDTQFTEEGLAVWHEHQAGLTVDRDLKRYALRYLAAVVSLEADFASVMDTLLDYSDFDLAFDTAVRAKRGFILTEASGCHVKDQVYFEGFRKVQAASETIKDLALILMVGKVSLGMVRKVRSLIGDGWLAPGMLNPAMVTDRLHQGSWSM